MTRAVMGLVVALLAVPACWDPCDQLANTICDCEKTEIERQQCRQRVEIQKQQRDPSEADKQACQSAQTTCTCEALAEGRLSACGFSR